MKRFIILIFLFLVNFAIYANKLTDAEKEHKLKYIYKLSKYITWTDYEWADDEVFVIAMIGDDPYGSMLENFFDKKKLKGKKVHIKRYKTIEDFDFAHIAIISDEFIPEIPLISKKHILLIGNSKDFIDKNGMISLFRYKNKIKFELNYKSAKCANIYISSKIAQIALRSIK